MIILIPKKKKIHIHITKQSKITYQGYFRLVNSYKILIDKISLQKNNNQTVKINEKELIKIMKTDHVIITQENQKLNEFLEEEKIAYKVKHVCESCLKYKNVTALSEKKAYTLLNKHYCKNCAKKYLMDVIKNNAFNDYNSSNIDILLNKEHDLMKILDIMENKYDPLNNPELSLYDTLPATEKEYEKININSMNIPEEFKEILNKKVKELLPVQKIALDNGLLEDENLLIVSATASGKTLIGEIAGITKALTKKKMIYLSPLVALANQKYRDFKEDYEKLGLKVVIKVGHNRVKTDEELHIIEESIEDADIIVATYEGLDYVLRSGNCQLLNDLGTVIIDEIHMLDNEERGHRLNGLVNRLLTLYEHAQIIGLSATIKNAETVAEAFDMKLVKYDKRPVKIERHIVPIKTKNKMNFITKLCKKEFNNLSSKNYYGQTIIFTDSRRNTQRISNYLNKHGVKSAYYHAGLTYNRKLEIEEAFSNQEISTIITTSALSNGVDFPASLVIFESLRMGFEWLTPNEFHQMLGRAGRPTYHDLGKVYLIPEINAHWGNEYDIALKLINSSVEDVKVLYDVDDVYEQVLSDICAIGHADIKILKKEYDNLSVPITFNEALMELSDKNMIKINEEQKYAEPTNYGIAVSKSFISVNTAEYIKNHIFDDVLDIALDIEQINNVYLSNLIINSFSDIDYKISSRLFSESIRLMFYQGRFFHILNKKCKNMIINIVNDFLFCDCYYCPICDCLEKNISLHIINRRLQGWSPVEISKEFKREYELVIYPGDIYSYLDNTIRILDAVKRIAKVHNIDSTYEDCVRTIKKIEEG